MPESANETHPNGGDDHVRAGTSGAPPARTASVPEIAVRSEGDRVVVAVRGELDLRSAERLAHALRAALAAAADGVDLELGEVEFCDCSALNMLISLRGQGLEQGKALSIRSAGPVVRRLLELTGTDDLFAGADDVFAGMDDVFVGTDDVFAGPGGESRSGERDARAEVVHLRRAMRTRPVIDLARGILMASFALSAEDAWRVLVEVSQHTNTKLHHLARDLVAAVQGEPPVEAVRDQVAAAVDRIRRPEPPVDGGGAHGR
ncbi:ANTAR domain-containing protein [Streptomyces sp. NPDC059894]|uniref:ANTAR domain-containing protein n=1 Tax=unclassified Streptomyces TaxID=2593676 RepID=UPI00365EF591